MKKTNFLIASAVLFTLGGKAQFIDNYASSSLWTQIGNDVSIDQSSQRVFYNNAPDGTPKRVYRQHGLALTNSWRYNFDFTFAGTGANGPGHNLVSFTAGNLDPVSDASFTPYTSTNQDAITAMFYSNNASTTPSTYILVGGSKNDNAGWQYSSGINLVVNVPYYITLERLNATNGKLSVYTDAARTIQAAGSPQCFVIDVNVQTNLNYIQHGNTSWGFSGRALTGQIKNSWLNNIDIVGTIAGSQTVCAISGDPSIFTNVVNPAIGLTSSANIQWQNSTDGGVTWNNIIGATSSTYDAPQGLTVTTLYRRLASVGCNVSIPSNTITITVQNCNTLNCEFSDNYSTNIGWLQTQTGTSVGGGAVQFLNCFGASPRRIQKNHGIILSNSWRLDFDFNYTAVGAYGPGHILAALTDGVDDPISASSGPTYPATNQDGIAAMFYSTNHSTDPSTFMLVGGAKDAANAWSWNSGIVLNVNTSYYISLERLNQTNGKISVYTDASRTIHATGSPQCFVIDPNVAANLSALQHGNTSWANANRDLTGRLDNTCLANTLFTSGSITASQKITCGTTPVALQNAVVASGPNSSYNFTYQWQASANCSGLWTDIIGANVLSYSPPALTQNTCYRRVAIGMCGVYLPSPAVTVYVQYLAPLNADFSLSGSIPIGNTSTFNITASSITNSGSGFGFTWDVSEIDQITGNVIAGTTMTNPSNWWNSSQIPTTTFPGYYGNATAIIGNGVFLQGHKYKISRGVWGDCRPYAGISKSIMLCTSCKSDGTPIFIIENETPNFTQSSMTATGIESKLPEKNSFVISPNPSNGVFDIKYSISTSEKGLFNIFDINGKIVYQSILDGAIGQNTINLEDLSNGVYYCSFMINNQNFKTEKLVIVK